MKFRLIAVALAALLLPGAGQAAEIKVLSTQATEQSYRELVPLFEKASGHKVTTLFTGTLDADKRLAAGERYDLLIMSSPSIDQHLKDGLLIPGSRTDLAKSGVAVAVRRGAAKPDIGTADAVKRAILGAKSIGYSTGPSGNIVMALFQRLGIADQIKPRLIQTISGEFVGSILASGKAELGFQQVSELSQFPGIDYVGPLPAEIQQYTTFSSGIIAGTPQAEAARALVKFITSPQAAPVFKRRGMEPG